MSYEIGFSPKGDRKVSISHKQHARDAWRLVEALQASDEEIRYIKVPQGYEIGIGELELLAEKEGDDA